jgi:hypothetical protein
MHIVEGKALEDIPNLPTNENRVDILHFVSFDSVG